MSPVNVKMVEVVNVTLAASVPMNGLVYIVIVQVSVVDDSQVIKKSKRCQ